MRNETRLQFSRVVQGLARVVAFLALTLALGLNLVALSQLPALDPLTPSELTPPGHERPLDIRPWDYRPAGTRV